MAQNCIRVSCFGLGFSLEVIDLGKDLSALKFVRKVVHIDQNGLNSSANEMEIGDSEKRELSNRMECNFGESERWWPMVVNLTPY